MNEAPEAQMKRLLASFDSAMLVTRTPEGELRSRPMMLADKEGGSELWFATSIASGKTHEIETDAHVNVSMQSDSAFVSVAGHAHVVRDRTKIAELWREHWKVWFPEGQDDPELALICVSPELVEYWDMRGAKGVRYAWEAAKAYVRGSKPESERGTHGALKMH